MGFLVCALGQFLFERKEHPLIAQLYVVKGFHSLTHKACLLNILQGEVSYHLCQSSKLAKHKTRAGKPQCCVVICPGEETLLKNVDSG